MTDVETRKPTVPSRRRWAALMLGLCLTLVVATYGSSANAQQDRAVGFMNQVAAQLQNAAKTQSQSAFLKVIRRHADTPSIAIYSLGQYREGLSPSKRRQYYNGVARVIAHYFATQTKEYKVAEFEMGSKSFKDGKFHFVDTRIRLATGSRYKIRWKLVLRKGRYKIADVRVVGYWLTRFLRSEFENFVKSRGGSVPALLAVLKKF